MIGRCLHGRLRTDHDFHLDEPTVRIFRTPAAGALRLDDDVAVSEAVHDGVVLRDYALAGHWFKVNVTTGRSPGEPPRLPRPVTGRPAAMNGLQGDQKRPRVGSACGRILSACA